MIPSSGITALLRRYRSGQITPQQFIQETYRSIEQCNDRHEWTYLVPLEETLQRVTSLTQEFSKSLPLYGVTFAIQDSIDWIYVDGSRASLELAGKLDRPLTTVLRNLMAAGAIPIGKNKFERLPLEYVNFALSAEIEGSGLRSAIFALTDSDVEIVLKSAGQSPSLLI
jgi:Asp-tRNA(Asn)/Glu-tRNA(Gln) amidotransferase A subunit family amidase